MKKKSEILKYKYGKNNKKRKINIIRMKLEK